jgi:hypothetical protein
MCEPLVFTAGPKRPSAATRNVVLENIVISE